MHSRHSVGGVVLNVMIACGCAIIFPRAGLQHYLTHATGPDAQSCGTFERSVNESRVLSPAETATVTRCMTDAYRNGRTFYFYVQGPGIDSQLAWGMLIRSGELMRFEYDSAPCGGPACNERFVMTTCSPPQSDQPITPDIPCSGH
jgi:hypothetical protein